MGLVIGDFAVELVVLLGVITHMVERCTWALTWLPAVRGFPAAGVARFLSRQARVRPCACVESGRQYSDAQKRPLHLRSDVLPTPGSGACSRIRCSAMQDGRRAAALFPTPELSPKCTRGRYITTPYSKFGLPRIPSIHPNGTQALNCHLKNQAL